MSNEISSKFWINRYLYLFPLIGILSYKLFFSHVLSRGAGAHSGGNFFNQLIIGGLICLALFSLFQNKKKVFNALKANWVLIVFLTYTFLSCFWSSATSVSLKRWIQFFGFFIIGLSAVCGAKDVLQLLKVFLIVTAISQFFSLLLILVMPSPLTIGYGGWKGLFLHKNQLGSVCVVSLAFWITAMSNRFPQVIRTAAPFILLITLILAVGSRSATAVAICFSVFFIFCFLKFPLHMPIKVLFLPAPFIVMLFFLLNYTSGSPISFVFREFFNRDTNFSGRTDLWQAVFISAKESPLLGVGYDAFWGTYKSSLILLKFDITWVNLHQSHNGYLDVFNELGFIGLVLFGFLLITTIKGLIKLLRKNMHIYIPFLLIIVSIVINNFTESSFCRQANLNWIFFVVITTIIGVESNKREILSC